MWRSRAGVAKQKNLAVIPWVWIGTMKNLSSEQIENLLEQAQKAREMSYSPYSGFAVGAALLCADGSIYRGANIENASYPVGICAERTALFKAVSEGHRNDLAALALCGGKGEDIVTCTPCGMCRQALSEFCGPEFPIIIMKEKREGFQETTLGDLLPGAFSGDVL